MKSHLTEETIQEAVAGDRRAFELLLEAKYDMIYRICYRWTGITDVAEDLTQEVCIKLACNLTKFRFESAFDTWLYRMVVNTARDWHKTSGAKAKREETFDPDAPISSHSATPEESQQASELFRQLHQLPEKQRDAVMLVLIDGLSHKQAANILDCKEKTVSWHIHKARETLAAWLEGGTE